MAASINVVPYPYGPHPEPNVLNLAVWGEADISLAGFTSATCRADIREEPIAVEVESAADAPEPAIEIAPVHSIEIIIHRISKYLLFRSIVRR